jgi:hypothetical protein
MQIFSLKGTPAAAVPSGRLWYSGIEAGVSPMLTGTITFNILKKWEI